MEGCVGGQYPKVSIPKLNQRNLAAMRAHEQNKEDRVPRACKTCRRRKVKCSGDTPRCNNCHSAGLECVYEQARRDRLREATTLNHSLVTLLRDLRERTDEADSKKIEDAISMVEDGTVSQAPSVSRSTLGKRNRTLDSSEDPPGNDNHGEAHVTASVGSNEDLDFLDEDLLRNREARDTGYVGQNSEVQWLRSVQLEVERLEKEPYGQPYGPPGSSQKAVDQRSDARNERKQNGKGGSMHHIADSSFYLDSDSIEVDIVVNPYEVPIPETAERLLDCYMEKVHASFPIILSNFESQLRRFIKLGKHNKSFPVPDKWRALMNLIYAIGAKYSHLVVAEWRGDERDHLIYMTRAIHLLDLNNTLMITLGPDLALVQATAVLSLYFLVTGHVSRSWIMIGVSIRLSLALGLHLRNEDPSADDAKKENLSQMWWSLHSLECLVSSITGRPPVVASEDCTVPLPQISLPVGYGTGSKLAYQHSHSESLQTSISGTAANDGHRLVGTIKINIILQKVLANLYAPRTAAQSWEFVQGKIKELTNELEQWAKCTTPDDVDANRSNRDSKSARERMLLKIYYFSIKILINRPCLCRTERRIINESDSSASFNSRCASACIKAARDMAALFPEKVNSKWIYEMGLWWSIVHNIMQSVAVLLLELAFNGKNVKDSDKEIMPDLKKLLMWLRAMQSNDPVAHRAYQVVRRILKNSNSDLQSRAEFLLGEDGQPDPVTQPFRNDSHNGTVFEHRPTTGLPQNENFIIPIENPGPFDFPYYQQPVDGAPHEYAHAQFSWPIREQLHTPVAFGNPFANSFDQGAPVISMTDLWTTPNLPVDLGHMSSLGLDQVDGLAQAGIIPPPGLNLAHPYFQPPPAPQ